MRSEETDFNSVCKQENSHGGREGTVKRDWGEMWIANLRGWGDRDTVCGNCYRIPQRAIIHSFTHHVASLLVLACTGLFQVFLWEFVCSFGLLFMLQVGLCGFFFHLSLSCIINVSKPRLSESFPPSPGTAEKPAECWSLFSALLSCVAKQWAACVCCQPFCPTWSLCLL